MSTSRTYTTTGRDIRNQARRVWLPLVLCALFVATLLAVPASALAATAHASGTTAPVCNACHAPHQARVERSLLSVPGSKVATATPLTESLICYTCHGTTDITEWDIETGSANSFSTAMTSGHSLEDVTDPDTTVDLTNSCTGCHGVHGDPASRANLPANEEVVDTTPDTVIDPDDPRTWCLSCHNGTHSWYATDVPTPVTPYEDLIQDPTRNASHYPTLGTFPGSTSNATYLASTHATGIDANTVQSLVTVPTETVTREQGDCLWCHASHRSTAAYDGLLAEYRASTDDDAPGGTSSLTVGEYAQACFECHGNSTGDVYKPALTYTDTYWETTAGAPDIYQYVSDTSSTRSGHQIYSPEAYYAVGSPLPCYECHNPHGSKNGNALMISDALGSSLDPTASAVENRYFCFACHTTLDGSTWYGSDGTAMVAVSAGTTAIGLDRTTAANKLTLSATAPHSRTNTTQGCTSFGCHGSVHNPNGGVSTGGVACYDCHGVYEAPMEDNGGSVGLSYHHVLGSTTFPNATTPFDGDEAAAFYKGSYPTTVTAAPGDTDVYCLSCHVDHDKFYNGAAVDKKGYNLRASLAASPTEANSDYNDTDGGICIACHATALTKSTLQKTTATESLATPAITLGIYKDKAHEYNVPSTFSGATNNTYNANCVKCHNDEEAQRTIGVDYAGYQTSTYKFGTHWSAENRIAAALGAASTGSGTSSEENLCFVCHNGDATASDGYGVMPYDSGMSSASRAVMNYFTSSTYANGATVKRHDVVSHSGIHTADESRTYTSANKHVECEDCHNPHALGNATTGSATRALGSNGISSGSPIAGTLGITYTSTTEKNTTWDPTNTTARTAPGTFGASATTASKEYEICLRCHSSANTSVWSWGTVWTDVALEFNTGNSSYHPVFGGLNSGGSTPLNSAQMWSNTVGATNYVGRSTNPAPTGAMVFSNVGNQTMYCSDCHGDYSATAGAAGPHGSTAPRVLKGYYPRMADGATYYTLAMVQNNTATGLLCLKCHPMITSGGNWINSAHNGATGHRSVSCTTCHLARPHGGKVSRLIVDDGRDGAGGTPAPYLGNNASVARYSKTTYSSYQGRYCLTVSGSPCGTQHNGGNATENW